MYTVFNPNPRGRRVGDCVIRAVAKALGKSWNEVYIELCIEGLILCDLQSSNSVWGKYLKDKGFTRELISDGCPDCYTIQDFCLEHPRGTYVIGTGGHAVCVIDGNIYDAWDSSFEVPIYYYKKGE